MREEVLMAEKTDRSEGEYMCVGKSACVGAHTCVWTCVYAWGACVCMCMEACGHACIAGCVHVWVCA